MKDGGESRRATEKRERAERLARELRENLRRRKAQSRDRSRDDAPRTPDEGSLDDDSGAGGGSR